MSNVRRGSAALRHAARVVIEQLEGRTMLAAGDPDGTFGGGDGFVSLGFTGFAFTHDMGAAMAVQSDGKIVLAGRSGDGGNTQDRIALARLHPDGTPDDTFGENGLLIVPIAPDVDINAVAIAPSGKIVVAGSATVPGYVTDWFVMRFNTDGTPDDTFGGGDGYVTRDFNFAFGDFATAVTVQADEKIVVTGVATQATSNLAVMRYDNSGSPDPTFSGDGIDVVDFFGGVDYASDVIIDEDNRIVIVGGSVPAAGYRRPVILRYTSAGVPDVEFSGDGRASIDFGVTAFGRQVMLDPAGGYILGGLHGGVGAEQNYLVARFDETGVLDPLFGTNPAMPGTTVFPDMYGHTFTSYGIARQADGKILFGGNSQSISNTDHYMGLVRLTAQGVPDATFGTNGARNYNAPGFVPGFGNGADIAIAQNGNILLFGDAYLNNNTDFALFQLVTEGEGAQQPVKLEGNVLVVTGTAGDDVLTLSADNTTFTAVLNSITYTFPAASVGSINVNLLEGNDTQQHTTGVPGGTVVLGDGNDTLTLGTGNKASPVLNVSGGAGDDAVTLGVAFFTSTNFDGGAGTDTLTYNGGQGNDAINISDTQIDDDGFFPAVYSTLERVRVLANFGFDTITMSSARNGVTYDILGGAGNDSFTIEPGAFATLTTFDGGADTDTLTYNSSQGDDSINITETRIDDDGFFPATYNNAVERINVFSNFGFDTINVRGTRVGAAYQIDGGFGDDLFSIFNSIDPDAFQGTTTLIGGDGFDDIFFDDSGNTFPDTYSVTPTQFTRDALAAFFYQTSEVLRLAGGLDRNKFNVAPSTTTEYIIDGNNPANLPGDEITVGLTGVTGTNFDQLGVGTGRYHFTSHEPVTFREIERDTTLWGPTVDNAAYHYDLEQAIEFVFSEQTFDINLTDLQVTNLTTGQTIPAGSFVLLVTSAPETPTTAKWTANSILPDGQYEARLPANSVRDWNNNPLTPAFVFNFRVLAGDANGDGKVNIVDYLRIDRGDARDLTGAANGDFNYDDVIDGADYFIIDQAYLASLPPSAAEPLAAETPVSVPKSEAPSPNAPSPASVASALANRSQLFPSASPAGRAEEPSQELWEEDPDPLT